MEDHVAAVSSLAHVKEPICTNCGANMRDTMVFNKVGLVSWQWHLQQVVLLQEPLKYLEKFL